MLVALPAARLTMHDTPVDVPLDLPADPLRRYAALPLARR
jgi:hypothetical protein